MDEDKIVELIYSSNFQIRVAVYSFTNLRIAEALVAKYKEGVDVRVVVDETSVGTKAFNLLKENGVPLRVYKGEGLMHVKLIIADFRFAFGSHNYSYSAFNKNIELSYIFNELFFLKYLEVEQFFEEVWEVSSPA